MMNEAGHLDRLAKFKVPSSKALEPFTSHYEVRPSVMIL